MIIIININRGQHCAYNDESYEVDPWPERMGVLYVVHYIDPPFETYHLETHTEKHKFYN